MNLLFGILCGIALSMILGFGPAFFSLIQSSLHYGFRKTTALIFGILSSDFIIVFLLLTVLRNANMSAIMHNIFVGTVGGLVLMFLGYRTFVKKDGRAAAAQSRISSASDTQITHRWQLFLNGFALNFFNPLIWLYWVSIITFLSAEVGLTSNERYVFFGGMLFAVLGCDLLKSRLASLMYNWFTPRVMRVFNRVIGVILMGFGLYLMVSMIVFQVSPKARDREQEQTQSTRIIRTLHDHIGRDTSRTKDAFAEPSFTDDTMIVQ